MNTIHIISPAEIAMLKANADSHGRLDPGQRDALLAEGYQYYRGERTTLASPDLVCALVDEIEQMKTAFGMLNAHLCDVRRKVVGR